MFGAGFEKVAVSSDFINKFLGSHQDSKVIPALGKLPQSAQDKITGSPHWAKFERSRGALQKLEGHNASHKTRLRAQKKIVSHYRQAAGELIPNKAPVAKKMSIPKKSGHSNKMWMAMGGAAVIGAGAFAAHKYLRKPKAETPEAEPMAHMDTNYEVPSHLSRDPAYQLFLDA